MKFENVIFCHDDKVRKVDDKYYGIAVNTNMLNRYYNLGKKLNLAIRVYENDRTDTSKYTAIEINGDIIECKNMWSLRDGIRNYQYNSKIMERKIKNTDFVIARLPSVIGMQAIDIAKKYKIPYMIELAGCPWDSFWNHSLLGKPVAPYMYLKTKKYVKNARFVLYVTNKFLQHRYPTKGKTVSCSNVELPPADDSIMNKRMDRIRKQKKKKTVLATVAAVNVRYKGQQYVIKAIAECRKLGYEFQYILIGGGDQDRLKKTARRNGVEDLVMFLGPIQHSRIFELLDAVDIYVQPSKTEGLPRAAIEAMSRGCLVLGSNAGGTPELLESKYVFEKGKWKDIAELLMRIEKEDLIQQCKINLENSKQYSKETISKRRLAFYQKIYEEICHEDTI